jgi:hypothetical protein
MPATTASTLSQATDRVKALRKSGVSQAKIASMIGVTPVAIRTILKVGAGKTRGRNKRRLLAWVAKAAGDAHAAPAASHAAAPTRRRRRGGRRASVAVAAVHSSGATSSGGGHVTIDLDGGRTLRLTAGQHYLLRNGEILHRL